MLTLFDWEEILFFAEKIVWPPGIFLQTGKSDWAKSFSIVLVPLLRMFW